MNPRAEIFLRYAAGTGREQELLDLVDCDPVPGTDLVLAATFADFTGRSLRQGQAVLRTLADRGDLQRVSLASMGIETATGTVWGYRPTPMEDT